jgi:mRNA interferase MazF
MISEGQIVLFKFPQTDQITGKLRPALILRRLPGQYNDWLLCMVSSHLDHRVPDFDEIITPVDSDFKESGLKVSSLIRIGRLAVVDGDILLGKLGQVDAQRLRRIVQKLCQWLHGI